jgi:dihydroxy-acid dehydratase
VTSRSDSGLRSSSWFDNPDDPVMSALYTERYLNYGISREELQSGRPIIGIAQTGNDLTPCNRHHVALASRVRDGIRDSGGIPLEFPVHPLQETGKRPTAALDRNLAYLGLVEVLFGYPLDGVVLTTGCDKTTPACLMAAATVNIPAIVLSGGPMLNGWHRGERTGAGTITWKARKLLASGEINAEQVCDLIASASPSSGHCNTMGTALTMNSLAEALGMSLPGCAAIPAPYRDRAEMAHRTGRRIVDMVREDLNPSDIMTKDAFENAIAVASAIGGSSNAPIHLAAIARHVGVDLDLEDWQRVGAEIPLLVDLQPVGRFLGEDFYHAGGVPAVVRRLIDGGLIHESAVTANGRTIGDNCRDVQVDDPAVIRPWDDRLLDNAGYVVLHGNLFDSAIMKVSAISDEFRQRYLMDPEHPDCFDARSIVFDGPEDYHARIDDPDLGIDERCLLVIRGVGPIGYPGSAEVVNMQPPAAAIRAGIRELPCLGDGRQSGTSGSPSILNASPEAAAGGGLAILRTGDTVRIDLAARQVNVLLPDEELQRRRDDLAAEGGFPFPPSQTPWQEFQRSVVGQLGDGMVLEPATQHQRLAQVWGVPRHSH